MAIINLSSLDSVSSLNKLSPSLTVDDQGFTSGNGSVISDDGKLTLLTEPSPNVTGNLREGLLAQGYTVKPCATRLRC